MTDMRSWIFAGALTLLATAPSFAMGWWSHPRDGNGGNGNTPITHSAPGPVVGLGLPALVVAGGYVWYRRRARQGRK